MSEQYNEEQEKYDEVNIYYCPVCEEKGVKRELIRHQGEWGIFWGCSGYRDGECKARFDDWMAEPQLPSKDHQCNFCKEGYMQRRKGNYGWYWQCDNEVCRKTAKDKHGDIVYRDVTEHKCPACEEGLLIRRKSEKGGVTRYWYGCSQFPKCSYKTIEYQGKPDFSKGSTNPPANQEDDEE